MKNKPSYMKQDKVYHEGYEKDQYEDLELEYFPTGGIPPRYIWQEDPEYQDNLLVEGLPPEAEETDDVVDILTQVPHYSMEERKKSPTYRIRAIGRLLDFHFVRPEDIEVYRDIHRFLRLSYREKNIDLRDNYKKVIELGNMTKKVNDNLLEGNKTIIKQGAGQVLGKLIIGVSGGGKSTGTELTLKHIPQVLVHQNTSDKYIQHEQIIWLKVECSPTGSIKGMCLKIIGEIDRILGKNYSARVSGGKVNVDKLMMEIKHLSILHSVGVLVIDEIQHLKATKDNEKVLNFFLTLSNEINLPIIYIGTQEAVQKVFSKNHRYARRAEGDGVIEYGTIAAPVGDKVTITEATVEELAATVTVDERELQKEWREKKWHEKDKRYYSLITFAIQKELGDSQRPIRITRTRLAKNIGAVHAVVYNIEKMPRTKALIEQCEETQEQYYRRKIKWAVNVLKEKGEEVLEWRILEQTRCSDKNREVVKQLIREIL